MVERLRRLAASILRRCSPEEIVGASNGELRLVCAWPYGEVHVLQALWQRLGIDQVIRAQAQSRRLGFDVERALFAMVANRACAPCSKLYCWEQWLKEEVHQGLQHLQQCLLDQSIQHRGNAQLALAPVRLGNHHLAHRLRPVRARQQRLTGLRPGRAQPLGRLLDVEPVHPRRAFVGLDPLPRRLQVLSRQRRLQQGACPRLRPCRPCARVLMGRAAGFVTGRIAPGFTVRYAHPPG